MTYRELIAQIEMFPYRLNCEVEFGIRATNAPHVYKPSHGDMIYREKKPDKFRPLGKGNYPVLNDNSTYAEMVVHFAQLNNERKRMDEENADYSNLCKAIIIVERKIDEREKGMLKMGMTEKELQKEIERIFEIRTY